MGKIKRIVSPKTGLEALLVQVNEFQWKVVPKRETILLSTRELAIAHSMNLNKDKFLTVKRLLLEGKNASAIYKETKTARTTIEKYRKLYCCETQEQLMNLPQ